MTVSWNKVSGATSYMVHHKLNSASTWTDSASLGDISAYTITGLAASTTYDITVTAINSAGSSPKSTQISLTTNAPTVTVPTAPTGLNQISKTDA